MPVCVRCMPVAFPPPCPPITATAPAVCAAFRKSPNRANDPGSGGGYGLWVYDFRELPLQTGGNLYYNGAQPYGKERESKVRCASDPGLRVVQDADQFTLNLTLGPEIKQADTRLVTTALLGKAKIPQLGYENADGAPLRIDTDYFGKRRNKSHPTPGPFEKLGQGELALKP